MVPILGCETARELLESFVDGELPTSAQVAVQAHQRSEQDGGTIAEALTGGEFETAIGKVAFDDKGDLAQNPYRLLRYDGDEFVPAE